MMSLSIENIENRYNQTEGKGMAKEALSQLKALGFPTTKHEEWKYTNVSDLLTKEYSWQSTGKLDKAQFNSLSLHPEGAYTAVFFNGVFDEQNSYLPSAEGIYVMPLSRAFQEEKDLVDKYLGSLADTKHEAFTALNTAFINEGLYVHLAHQHILDKPLYLYHIQDGESGNVFTQLRNLWILGKNSQAHIQEISLSLGGHDTLGNTVTEISLWENAQLEYVKIQDGNPNSSLITNTFAHQRRDSRFTSSVITFDGHVVRNNLTVKLDDENCEANMYGLVLADGTSHVDNHTAVDHAKPRSLSNELYKNVLGGHATAVFNGKIFVRKDAQKTLAYQSNKNILLSDSASVNTKPQLEIWADDVKCSHGATSGQLDEQALFYLRARGIGDKLAKALLVQAFAEEVIDHLSQNDLKEVLRTRITEKLQHLA